MKKIIVLIMGLFLLTGCGSKKDKVIIYSCTEENVTQALNQKFKEDLKDTYGEEVVKLEHLEGDLYQAYVNKDGSEVPFVVVSARTGYFHG